MTAFISFLNIFADYCVQHPFLSGIFAGLLLILFLELLFSIIRIFFFPKRLKEISYDMEGGKVSIRVSAVADLIRAAGMEFPELSIIKTLIRRKHGKTVLHIILDYEIGRRAFQDVSAEFRKRINDILLNSFGIPGIGDIEISLRNTTGSSTASHPDAEKQDEKAVCSGMEEDVSLPADLHQF